MRTINKFSKFLFIPIGLFFLQSCFVAKTYESPNVKTTGLYRIDTTTALDSTSMADIPWQQVFTDTILQRYINQAIENNYDIRIAIQNINTAKAYLRQGQSGQLPTLNVQAGYNLLHPSKYGQYGATGQDPLQQYNLTANLSWEADIWGKIRSQEKALNAKYLQTLAAHKAVKTRLISSVASIYYQLLALDKQEKITKQSIKNSKNSLEVTKSMKEAGYANVTAAAVKQTEAQVYNSQVILLGLKNNVKHLENTLSILLAQKPHSIKRSALNQQQITTTLKTGVPSLLMKNRPDVIAAEYNLINAFELTNVAKASFYPSLTITASAGLSSLAIDNWFTGDAFLASIGAGLLAPIFNHRQIRTQYEVALTQKETALLNYKQTILNAGEDVANALTDYKNATEKIAIQTKQVDALQKATDYSQELLKYGLATYLQVLTARDQALNAELGIIDSRYQQLDAMVSLYQALGGGWE
ncbi:MAG TPA: TolC family protein [Chitinophagaceae bacterium]|nr:TolC family protein [Chitinophagaceae bacterium]